MLPALHLARHPVAAASAAVGVAALAGWAIYRARRGKVTAEELERRRRERLAADGRIVDGTLLDAYPSEADAQVLLYEYRVAGVSYQCSQDVTALPPVKNLRIDYPVLVRYRRENPADSIVVAELWSGLHTGIAYVARQQHDLHA